MKQAAPSLPPAVRPLTERSVPDEGGLPGGVLPHQQHHGLTLEVGPLKGRRVEVMEEVGLLQRQQLLGVERLESLRDRLVHLSFLVAATLLLFHPAEHSSLKYKRSNFPFSGFPNVPDVSASLPARSTAREKAGLAPGSLLDFWTQSCVCLQLFVLWTELMTRVPVGAALHPVTLLFPLGGEEGKRRGDVRSGHLGESSSSILLANITL